MLICFDLDGTIISPYIDSRGHHYHDWSILSGRRKRMTALLAEGHTIGIITNQAGVAFGRITEEDFQQKMQAVLSALRLPKDTPIAACFAHPRAPESAVHYRDPEQLARRKPSGAMIREMMALRPDAAIDGVLYVGDKAEDQQAAQDAEVDFMWAWDFFEEVRENQNLEPRWQTENKGNARLDIQRLVIVVNEGTMSQHEIDLSECTDAARMLDALLLLSRKAWCTPDILFDVVLCVEEASQKVHNTTAQNIFCPLGQFRSILWD